MLPFSETAARSHLRALLQESAGRDPGLEVERPVGGDGAVLEQVVADLKRPQIGAGKIGCVRMAI